MIRIENLSKRWNNFILKDINLEIERGEYFVVLGPTGAGKTLLLETIAGFHYPDEGKIYIDGRDVTFVPASERNIGFVYQDYMLFPHMSVKENIAYGLKLRGVSKEMIERKVEEIAETYKIKHLLSRYPENLSGGEKQRVAIARAMVVKPKILLLDEPLSSIDPRMRAEVRREMKEMHERDKITAIHVTHSREDAMLLADRIAVMNEGKIIQIGKPKEIFRNPSSRFVAEFVGVENIFSGKAEKKGNYTYFVCDGIRLISSMNVPDAKYASIRPEDIIVSKNKIESSARNCIKGRVKAIVDTGSIIRLEVDCGVDFIVHITKQSFEDMQIKIGEEIYLVFKAQNVHLFR